MGGRAEKSDQGEETARQRDTRVKREYAKIRRLERELGPARYRKLLEASP